MKTSNIVQIGLLAVIALLLGYILFGGKSSSADTDVRSEARQSLSTTPKVASNANLNPNDAIKPAEPAKPVGPTTTFDFSEKEYDFGTITSGEKVTHVFKFKNTGKEPLVIQNAKGSCGCTVPEWPREPIAPGKSGEIKVQFDSKNKQGKQTKNVTITANTDPVNTILKVSADVEKDPNAPATPAPATQLTPKIQTQQ